MKPYSQFTLAEWLFHLENRFQQEIQLGLTRIQKVAKTLDLLDLNAKIITVAGTNGKGSTVAALEAVYLTAGYQTAAYTSPHLIKFNERIRLNGKSISDEALCAAFRRIEEARGDTILTYFEMTTLAALYYFKSNRPQIVILEVGLGGRLDATNIIDSDLAIITTIDLDHQAYLGNTKEAIGYEKAGILRPGRPLIYADNHPPASVLEQALSLKAPCYRLNQEYSYSLNGKTLQFTGLNQRIDIPKPHLHSNSIAAAMMATTYLQESLPLAHIHWQKALKNLCLPGRLQVIEGRVTHLLDVSHNPQAVSYLAEFTRNLPMKGKIHAVFSALKDKDVAGMIGPMISLVDHWYPALLTGSRAASIGQITEAFAKFNKTLVCHTDPLAAWQQAYQQAKPGDLIIIYGSFITVGWVLPTVTTCRKMDLLQVTNRIDHRRYNEISN